MTVTVPINTLNAVADNATPSSVTVAAAGGVIPLAYGRTALPAHVFAVGMIETDLVLGCAWCLGEIEEIETLLINGAPISAPLQATHYTGTQTQPVDPWLAEAIEGYEDTLADILNNYAIAYSVIRIPQLALNGFPQATAIIKGKKLFDPRVNQTRYSANSALVLADWMQSPFGHNLNLNRDSIIEAANFADTPLPSGIAKCETHLSINQSDDAGKYTDILKTYAQCFTERRGGEIHLTPDTTREATSSIQPNLWRKNSFKVGKTGFENTYSVVYVTYTNANLETATVGPVIAPGVETGDIPWKETTINLPGYRHPEHATRYAVRYLNRGWLSDLYAECIAFDEAAELRTGHVYTVTDSVGLADKPMKLIEKHIIENNRFALRFEEYDPNIDSDTVTTAPSTGDTNLAAPTTPPTPNINASTYIVQTGSAVTYGIKVTLDRPIQAYYARDDIEYRKVGDTNWTPAQPASGQALISPAEKSAEYEIRARTVNVIGQASDWRKINHRTDENPSAPTKPTGFVVKAQPDGTREYAWQQPNAANVKGWVIRYGQTANWDSMNPLHDGVLTFTPFEANYPASGTYWFGIKAISYGDQLSDTTEYVQTTLGDPRLAGVVKTIADDFSGSKSGCEIDGGYLVPLDSTTWATLDTWANFTVWRNPSTNRFTYTTPVYDIGYKIPFNALVQTIGSGEISIEYRYKLDSGSWTAWSGLGTNINAQFFQIRVTVANGAPFSHLKSLSTLIDTKTAANYLDDFNTATAATRIGVGDVRLPLATQMTKIRTVAVALQNTGPGYTWELIDKNTTGPRIKIYNASGQPADALIDATITGF